MKRFLSILASLSLAALPAGAQVCAPVVPSGQPALAPFPPACLGTVPPPAVWLGGNPGFAVSLAPIVPAGWLSVLVLSPGMPMPLALPPGMLSPVFGGPGIFLFSPMNVLFSPGLTTGAPMVVPLALPPSGGPSAPWFTVQAAYVSPLGVGVLTPGITVTV